MPRLVGGGTPLTPESAAHMRKMYEWELAERCRGTPGHIGWKEFKKYAEDKEAGQSSSLSLHLKTVKPYILWLNNFIKNYGISSTSWTRTAMVIWMPRN